MSFPNQYPNAPSTGGSNPALSTQRQQQLAEAEVQRVKENQYGNLREYGKVNISNVGRKRVLDKDEYLEGDDSDDGGYMPAPGSPGAGNAGDSDESDDPLDAFMAGVEVQANKDKVVSQKKAIEKMKMLATRTESQTADKKKQLGRIDIDGEGAEDMQESYFKWMEEHKEKKNGDEDNVEVEYDHDGNPMYTWKKVIDPLPPVDHHTIAYVPFESNFYKPHDDIEKLSKAQIFALEGKLDIKMSGLLAPTLVTSFAHFAFDKHLMDAIRRANFTQPTPIQSAAIPALLSGRDVIGIAKTGSGKTLAYIWPALVHLMAQRELADGDGPIVAIIVPTRELALQVHTETRKFGRVYNIRSVCAYGGGNKWEQTKALGEGCEIVVATPGRLIDMVKMGATNLTRVTYLVFDEADRMFNMGFEPQVRSISKHIRPDRQCSLFSATFKKKVEHLARDALQDAVRIVQGEVGEANADVAQEVHICGDQQAKFGWLMHRLVDLCTSGKVLIFVTKKADSDYVAELLKRRDFDVLLMHGDMHQATRNEVISAFRNDPSKKILVATDVAARGLDIPSIRTVINYDTARDIDTHVHRVGRTGRAGQTGYAFTLLTDKDKEFAGHIVRCMESANQLVGEKLLNLAMQSEWFKASRKGGATTLLTRRIGGAGLGYVEPKAAMTGASTSSSTIARVLAVDTSKKSRYVPTAASISAAASGDVDNKPVSRLSAIKQAFNANLTTKFQRSSADNEYVGKMNVVDDEETKPEMDPSAKKRSRWGD